MSEVQYSMQPPHSLVAALWLCVVVALVLHLMVLPVIKELRAARQRTLKRGGAPLKLPPPAAFDDEDDWSRR